MSKVAKAFVGNDGMAHKQDDSTLSDHMECGVELSADDCDVFRRPEAAQEAGYERCGDCWE